MNRRTATQWGVYDVEVSEGRITAVTPLAIDPDPSPIGQALVDTTQGPLRIRKPAIRKSWLEGKPHHQEQRGAEAFVEVEWNEALELAAAELHRVIDNFGNTAIYGGSYGWASAGRFHHAQSQLHRFMNHLGGCTRSVNSYSTAAAQVILPHVVCPWPDMELHQPTWAEIADGGQLVVSFGGLPLRNAQVAYGGITLHEARDDMRSAAARGIQFINIGPMQTDAPEFLNPQWISARPGTDVALMLGLAFVLETEGLTANDFLHTHCVGYQRFRAYLLGETDNQPKTPVWASGICDVDETLITNLARRMASERTFLSASWSLQRAHHGEQPYWMLVTLACMLGYIGERGGGFGFGYANEGFIGGEGRRFKWQPLNKGKNATGLEIPVARIADMLLNPGTRIDFDGKPLELPDIRLVYWAGGNPFHHHQDLNRLVKAWRKPETVIVHEPWWTPIARQADIVFPATTALERNDICASSHDAFAHAMHKVIEPQGEARSDFAIFSELAALLGIEHTFTEGRGEMEWLAHIWDQSRPKALKEQFELPDFESFWNNGIYQLPTPAPRKAWLADFREDPDKHPLSTPSGKLELYSDTIAGFDYQDCPGHACWMEPLERLGGAGTDRHTLHLISHQPARRLHSQLDHSAYSQEGKIGGREVMRIHPDTAQARGIQNGDTARVYNDRGQCLAGVHLDSRIRRDVVALPTGAWFNPAQPGQAGAMELAGNPNVLTPDIGTSSLAQGPCAHTCLVEVKLFQGETDPPDIYTPPPILRR